MGWQGYSLRSILEQAPRAAHVEEPLPEISRADVVDSDSPISSNIFADVMYGW
jgi:hypothetical protein